MTPPITLAWLKAYAKKYRKTIDLGARADAATRSATLLRQGLGPLLHIACTDEQDRPRVAILYTANDWQAPAAS